MVFSAKLYWKWGKKKWMNPVQDGERQTIRWWFVRRRLIDVLQQCARSTKSCREFLCSKCLSYTYSKGSACFIKRVRINSILEVSFCWPEKIPCGFIGTSPLASSVPYLFFRQVKDDPSFMYNGNCHSLLSRSFSTFTCETSKGINHYSSEECVHTVNIIIWIHSFT